MSTAENGGDPQGSVAPASPSARRATSGATAPAGKAGQAAKPVDGSPLRRVSPMRDGDRAEPGSGPASAASTSGSAAGGAPASKASSSGAPTTPVPVTPPASAGSTAPARSVAPTPATSAQPRPASARRVRLTVSRVDPWSAMKISFLLSVALGIAGVVMVSVLWTILNGMGVFDQINGVVGQIVQDETARFDVLDFIGFRRVVSLSIVIGVIDVILVTAIATLGAFLYNVSSALVGGLQLTLTDD